MKTYFLNHLNLSMLNCLVLLLLSWCAKVLTILEVKTWLSPLAKRKSLVLDTKLDKWNLPGIANLLQSSPYLEKLVINLVPFYNSEVRFYFIVRTTATLFFFSLLYFTIQSSYKPYSILPLLFDISHL